jgi:hypothetical protein
MQRSCPTYVCAHISALPAADISRQAGRKWGAILCLLGCQQLPDDETVAFNACWHYYASCDRTDYAGLLCQQHTSGF